MSGVTKPEDSVRRLPAARASVVALAVVWSAEPGRVGELLLPPPGASGVFGRGAPQPDDPDRRLLLVRQQPGKTTPSPPLALDKVSRVQLALRAERGTLTVENRGRLRLKHNGDAVERCQVVPGDVLTVGQQLVFLAVSRPAVLPSTEGDHRGTFGAPDADGIVGESAPIWALRQAIQFVTQRTAHVLVLGPSGTGKELVAQALHSRSPRGRRPFVSRNAATIPDGLVDAELFGNLRGYPNPGMPDRPGLVGRADGSTLFLDEFAELSPAVQTHLLRVLDAGEYQRLGETDSRRSDFRLIAATNRPLAALKDDVAARFLLRIDTPELNDRLEDVPMLVRHLLAAIVSSDAAAAARFVGPEGEPRVAQDWMAALVRHRYKTNVRELHALVWEAVRRSQGDLLGDGVSLPRADQPDAPVVTPGLPAKDDDPMSAARLQRCLDEHNGNIEATAKALGLANRYVLRRMIQKLRLEVRRRVL